MAVVRLGPFVVALTLAVAAPALGADEQKWDFVAFEDGGGQLFYGIPESDALSTIALICEVKAKHITMVSGVLPRRPAKGQAFRTTLSNGKTNVTYAGTINYSGEGNDGLFFAEAQVPLERSVVDVFKSGATLTVSIPGKQERVPLRGAAEPVARFEAACFR